MPLSCGIQQSHDQRIIFNIMGEQTHRAVFQPGRQITGIAGAAGLRIKRAKAKQAVKVETGFMARIIKALPVGKKYRRRRGGPFNPGRRETALAALAH
jgi:hypothetical protein